MQIFLVVYPVWMYEPQLHRASKVVSEHNTQNIRCHSEEDWLCGKNCQHEKKGVKHLLKTSQSKKFLNITVLTWKEKSKAAESYIG